MGNRAWDWLLQAERDLEQARDSLQAGRHEWACFASQQAAEKAVKAFLYAQGAEDVRGHSVANLLQDAGTYSANLVRVYAVGAALDKFYIPTRYPNGLPGGTPMEAFLDDETIRAIAQADQVLVAVRSLLWTDEGTGCSG
jgi:HEPN domain-containing protein